MTSLLEDETYFDAWFNVTPAALELYQTVENRLMENIELARAFRFRLLLLMKRSWDCSFVLFVREE